MVAIFWECNAPYYTYGTNIVEGLGADNKYVFLNMSIPGQLRGAHFVGDDAGFVRKRVQSIFSFFGPAAPTPQHHPSAPQIPSRYPAQPTSHQHRNKVLVLVDSYYKVKSRKSHFLNKLYQESPWELDVVPLPGGLLSQMREELQARAEHLHLYAGVLVVSMGNDLTNNRWNNISESQFAENMPALQEAISGMAALLHQLDHHYVIYGGAGRLWWCSHPSEPLGETYDTRRDWVVNALRTHCVHADTGETELTQLGYTVNDVDRFHHKTSGAEKALSALLQWIAEACS